MTILTTAEAARRLGIPARRLRAWRSEGRGPRWLTDPTTGTFVGYEQAAVDEWLDEAREAAR